jgi:hypothetical protein
VDAEFKFVAEEDAPGVTAFRQDLFQILDDQNIQELDHEQIISKLGDNGTLFRIPYSSIFLELDCGY